MKKSLHYSTLILIFLFLINTKLFASIAPRFILFKNSSQLLKPTTPKQYQYRRLIGELIFQTKNCPGITGSTRRKALARFGKSAYLLLDKYYKPDTDILLLKKKGKIAGILFFSADPNDHLLDIIILAIHEKYHKKGYGKLLVNELHRNFPFYTARLSVFKENTGARLFYEKLGYYLVGEGDYCLDFDKKLP